MKVNPKAKYLQDFFKQAHHQGLSTVNFLLFLLIIGSLVLIAWSIYDVENYLSSQETEARTDVSWMNRAQQAFFLENNYFTDCLENLGLAIQPDTKNYSYRIAIGIPLGKNRYRFVLPSSPKKSSSSTKEELNITLNLPPQVVMNVAIPKNPQLKTYVGLSFEEGTYSNNPNTIRFVCESNTRSLLWESKKPYTLPPEIVLMPPKIAICSGDTRNALSPPEGFQAVYPIVKRDSNFWDLRLPWF